MNCLAFTIPGGHNLYHNRCSELREKTGTFLQVLWVSLFWVMGFTIALSMLFMVKRVSGKACFLEGGKHDNHVYN